ncbi:SDR family NAD(P)-dependent oxidoreductase [Pseudonocardia pini]|uniref:SDR family NAD(P)-dependent oxidoreductase n=1 Tax=Pseudonocardia pini TaxID=2758030 RepID=UPI0015F0D319|nr:SDR family oxidoreductase [Pseudonocardia pini]
MDLSGARTLVVGASGVLGGALAAALEKEGARVVTASRRAGSFDAMDLERCAAVVDEAAAELGGLDLLVVAIGVAAFGPEAETDVVTEHLFTVNTMAPMAFVRAALPRFDGAGTVCVLSAILADVPTPGMAAYSASKAGLSAWLTALRGEQRKKGVRVFDVRPPHIETGLAGRAVAGEALPLKAAAEVDELVGLVLTGLREDSRELTFDLRRGEFARR